MVLIHDLVEIDAGDTYAYDAVGGATQHTREEAAAQRIYGLLPEDQGKWLYDLWEEFEAYETPEAKYAHMLDNSQPLFLNNATDLSLIHIWYSDSRRTCCGCGCSD